MLNGCEARYIYEVNKVSKLSNPNESGGTTETRIAKVYRDTNGIVIITMKDCDNVDEYDVMDLNLVIRQKCGNEPGLKLLIATARFDLDKKARIMARKEDNLSKTMARAIMVSNSVKASLFNFLRQFGKKGYPQQFFNNESEAHQWLLSFKQSKAG